MDPSTVVKGTMTDERDGQTYKTVKIGTQTWMAENLNYADLRPTQDEDSSSFCYKDSVSYCAKYGRLYTWAAAMDSVGTWTTKGKGCGFGKICWSNYSVRGVCPKGWHLPDTTEWNTLFIAVGGRLTAGRMLKSISGWNGSENGVDVSDVYSFAALPAGNSADGGIYHCEGDDANFWSSTEDNRSHAYFLTLFYSRGIASLAHGYKNYGFSVRCLKD